MAASCTTDYRCETNFCECSNASCSARVCATSDCLCRYSSSGGCTTNLNDGVNDRQDCAGDDSCYAGVCLLDNGQTCSSDSACGNGNCECDGANCSTRECSAVDCTCTYNTNGTTSTCDGPLNNGLDDPQDCVGVNGCYAGVCLLDNGQSCTGDSACGSGNCECVNSSCSGRECSAVACVCGYNTNGTTATCDGSLNSGTLDPEDCDGTSSCFGGQCKAQDGQPCSADTNCGSNNCECTNASCGSRECSAVGCLCTYNTDGTTGSCDGDLSSGIDDPEDCIGIFSCYAGACEKDNGASCTTNTECNSNQCECIDAGCSAKVCSAVDCDCEFNISGNSSCDGPLNDGEDDGDNSCGAQTCNGVGACNLANNAPCTANFQCESNECECRNATCSSKRCSAIDCDCRYNSNGDGSCDGNINDGEVDGDGSCGTESCNGQGACNLANNVACTANFQCESNECECANAACDSFLCSAVDCDCEYNSDGNSSCNGNLNDGEDDGDNSCGAQTCNGAGICHVANAGLCSVDGDCESNTCECADATCSIRECSATDCDCRWNTDGDGVCDGPLDDGRDDPDNSCGAQTCNGAGGCNLPNGTTGCAADSACESNNCECQNAACGGTICSQAVCACRYNTNGNNSCNGDINDGLDDPGNTCGVETCNGAGVCNQANGATGCSADFECESNNCECNDAGCTQTVCSQANCPCGWNGSGDNSCNGNINDGLDDPPDTCGAESCNGLGGCNLPNGTTCGSDVLCESNECECIDAGCTGRMCSAVDCVCQINTDGNTSCDGPMTDGGPDPQDCLNCIGGSCS
ncbi:MAG: hypothetical protein V3T05_00960 [Myxococcota bacterium]